MSLQQWAENGWLRAHQTSPEEIENLLAIVDRDLRDASGDISDDWRFGIAYNAALKLCTILLYVSGYRAEQNLQHYRTIHALPFIFGDSHKADAQYLDVCRSKRNTVEYDYVGEVTDEDANELIQMAIDLREQVITFLRDNHPELLYKNNRSNVRHSRRSSIFWQPHKHFVPTYPTTKFKFGNLRYS